MPPTYRRFRQTVHAAALEVTRTSTFGGTIQTNSQFRAPRFTSTGPGQVATTSASNQFAGRTNITSASATVVISTSIVKSDSIVFLGFQLPSNEAVTTSLGPLCVKTISDGGYFTVGWANGGNVAAAQVAVLWKVDLA